MNDLSQAIKAIFIAFVFSFTLPVAHSLEGPAKSHEAGIALELKPEIRAQISKIDSPKIEGEQLRLMKLSMKDPAGETLFERHFERLDNGLWITSDVFRLKGNVNVRRIMAFSGLIELGRTIEFGNDISGHTVIPVGKLMLPVPTNRKLFSQGHMTATTLAANLDAVANPVPGSKFEFYRLLEGKSTVAVSGGFLGGSNRTSDIRNDRKFNCAAGEPGPAHSIHANLQGSYLPVTCDSVDASGARIKSDWAFLIQNRLYVLLGSNYGGREETYRVLDVEYLPGK